MNKIVVIIMTLFMLWALVGCGSDKESTAASKEVLVETTTIVTTTTAEETTTVTTTTTTSTKKSLKDLIEVKEYAKGDNKSYSFSGIDFSVPQYWTLDKSEEKSIKFYHKPKECDSAVLYFTYADGNATASDFEKARDELQKKHIESQTEFSNITNEQSFDGDLPNGAPYRCFQFDGKTSKEQEYRKYVTMFFDESTKRLFFAILYQPFDTKYDYVTDYASIVDDIEWSKTIEVSIDGVRIGQDSLGRSIAIVDMTYTNSTNSNQMFFTNYDCRVYQNKVELDNALFVDGVDSGALGKTVQPGGTLTLSEAFVLNDSSGITVEITRLLETKPIVSEKYTIN